MRTGKFEIVGGPKDGERMNATLFTPTNGRCEFSIETNGDCYDLRDGRLWWRPFNPEELLMAIFSDDEE